MVEALVIFVVIGGFLLLISGAFGKPR